MNEPKITVKRDASGRVRSVYIRLREGKAAFSSQPNPEALVFFELGKDRMPVGISFLAPIKKGVAYTTILHVLSEDEFGKPLGVDQVPNHYFHLTKEQREQVFEAAFTAAQHLDAAPAG